MGTDHEDEISTWLCRVAIKVHYDIKTSPAHDYIRRADSEHDGKVMPESLYLFVCINCLGELTEAEDTVK